MLEKNIVKNKNSFKKVAASVVGVQVSNLIAAWCVRLIWQHYSVLCKHNKKNQTLGCGLSCRPPFPKLRYIITKTNICYCIFGVFRGCSLRRWLPVEWRRVPVSKNFYGFRRVWTPDKVSRLFSDSAEVFVRKPGCRSASETFRIANLCW